MLQLSARFYLFGLRLLWFRCQPFDKRQPSDALMLEPRV